MLFNGLVLHAVSFESGVVRVKNLKVIDDKFFMTKIKEDFNYNKFIAIIDEKIIPITTRMSSDDFIRVFNLKGPLVKVLLTFDDDKPLKDRLFTKKLYTELERIMNNA